MLSFEVIELLVIFITRIVNAIVGIDLLVGVRLLGSLMLTLISLFVSLI